VINSFRYCSNFAFNFNVRRYILVPNNQVLAPVSALVVAFLVAFTAGAYTRSHFHST